MFDVLIIGGGLVGASLACALGHSRLRVGLIEPRQDFSKGYFGADGRASAIALGSSRIWETIGVWSAMVDRGVTPMHRIQISDGEYPHTVGLQREDMGVEALGYIVENRVTLAALWEYLQTCPNVERICPGQVVAMETQATHRTVTLTTDRESLSVDAKLIVAADGSRSALREMAGITIDRHTYGQACLVATVQTTLPHHNIAYERFRESGPFAILPLDTDRCCVVWTVKQEDTATLLALPKEKFQQKLQEEFGHHLGEIRLLSEVSSYVPQWMHARTYLQPRFVLLGDAAHATHPVAGQGMNLGIRDVATLSQVLCGAAQRREDVGTLAVLHRYQTTRYWDNLGILYLTDLTNRIFSQQTIGVQFLRRLGLFCLGFLPLKQVLMYLMMGLHCSLPKPDRNCGHDTPTHPNLSLF